MLLSGSLAPAPRTCAAVGRKELREAQSRVGAAAKASERRAQAEDAEREHVTRGSLGQANERTSALKRLAAWESL